MENVNEYWGIDVAGTKNTWFCSLIEKNEKLQLMEVSKLKLGEIVDKAKIRNVRAVAIDAQLTWSIFNSIINEKDEENVSFEMADTGFRNSEVHLKAILKIALEGEKNYLASQNSLMAVPVRGRQLAEYLQTRIPTIIETHPRVNFVLSDMFENHSSGEKYFLIKNYKTDDKKLNEKSCTTSQIEMQKEIVKILCKKYKISTKINLDDIMHDGVVDSLMCAITAYLTINKPDEIVNLTSLYDNKYSDLRGFAPFIVLNSPLLVR